MAIQGYFEVTVSMEGIPLPEYPVPKYRQIPGVEIANAAQDRPWELDCFVEAVPRKQFQLDLRLWAGFDFGEADYVSFEAQVDGVLVRKPIVRKTATVAGSGWEQTIRRIRSDINTGLTTRTLHFGELGQQQNDPIRTADESKSSKIGMISVKIRRSLDVEGSGGPLTHARPKGVYKGRKVDDKPLAVFRFHYRTRAALQELGIYVPTPLSWTNLAEEEKGKTVNQLEHHVKMLKNQVMYTNTLIAQEEKLARRIRDTMHGKHRTSIKREVDDDKENIDSALYPQKKMRADEMDLED